jgi:hypothetical protein
VPKEKEIRMLNVGERKILRKIFGAKKDGNELKIPNNQELRNMCGQTEIIGVIKSKRLGWLGHVVRMEEDRMVKRIFEGHTQVEEGRLIDLGSDGWMILKRIVD